MKEFTVFRTFFCSFGCLLLASTVFSIDADQTCAFAADTQVPAYTDWPFRVDCKHLKKFWRNTPSATDADEFKCNITHDGVTTNEGIFELSTPRELVYRAKLVINNTSCVSSDVIIDLKPFPEVTCNEIVNGAAERDELKHLANTIGDRVDLRCIPPEGTPTLIPEGANPADFETYWYTKCLRQRYRNNNLWKNLPDPEGYPMMLNMPRVDFWDATNFTCTVTYKRKTLYPVTYAQCIKQRITETDPTVACTQVEKEPNGGTAELDCVGQIVIGTTSSEDFLVEWGRKRKEGKFVPICKNKIFNEAEPGLSDPRQSCEASGNNDSLVCVVDGDAILDDDIQRERKKIKTTLTIKNLQGSDFGDYSLRLKYKRKSDGVWLDAEFENIKLEEDLTPFYEKLALGLGLALGFLLVSSAVAFLLWRYRIYIYVAYKRSRLTKYDKDDKPWVAYVSYYFNREAESEQEKKSNEATCKIVDGIHKVMENLGYSYYDEQRQGDFSVAVERVTNLVENCHRMILVLTPQYLDDKWRRFHAELGFHGLLESRMGLVVILTPGSKKLLEKRAKCDAVWDRLLIALKTNRVINWKEKMSEDELMNHIEYSLPKLRKSRKARTPSDCDSVSAADGINIPEYHRSQSQMTATTTISPDAPPADLLV